MSKLKTILSNFLLYILGSIASFVGFAISICFVVMGLASSQGIHLPKNLGLFIFILVLEILATVVPYVVTASIGRSFFKRFNPWIYGCFVCFSEIILIIFLIESLLV